YFDQDGISPKAAKALVKDKPLPESLKQTPTSFKVGFGGEPLLFPEPVVHAYNPLIRLAYNSLFSGAKKSTRKKVINLLRLG
ncbi:MAG TPA: hypothetical protein VE553_06865, partial [Candidatus Binatia bacterium]|nr:hypothetical protein [Candidatus Binatia bacterium]